MPEDPLPEFKDDYWKERHSTEYREAEKRNDSYRKLWDKHQNDEYKQVNRYKEAVCALCFKKDVCTATIANACEKCAHKMGVEAVLAVISNKLYDLCLFCGKYDFHVLQFNLRLCRRCNRMITNTTRALSKAGGIENYDPFYLNLKQRLGHDWKILFSQPSTRRI